MRTFFRVLAALLLVVVVIGIGTAIYNQGVTAGMAESAQQATASGEAAPANPGWWDRDGAYIHGPAGAGFGILAFVFGTVFTLLLIVVTVGLARIAFGGWRGGGPGSGPGGWSSRRDRVEEWHRDMHRRDGPDGEPRPAGA